MSKIEQFTELYNDVVEYAKEQADDETAKWLNYVEMERIVSEDYTWVEVYGYDVHDPHHYRHSIEVDLKEVW